MATNTNQRRGVVDGHTHDLRVGEYVVAFTQKGEVWGRLARVGYVAATIEVSPGRFVTSHLRHVHPASEGYALIADDEGMPALEIEDPSGWQRVCEVCWYSDNPDRYLPAEAITFDECERCGDLALLYGTR